VFALVAVVALLAESISASAQHDSNGRARAFARLPDWTGLWENDFAAAIVSGELETAANTSPARMREILQRLKLSGPPPYNAEWQKKAQDARKQLNNPYANGFKGCQPVGFPGVMDQSSPESLFEIAVTPEETLFVFAGGQVRHVYTDGRPHPKAQDIWPTALGDSIGHWEGQSLVVDTIARKAGPVFPGPFAELSERVRITERIQQLDRDTMQDHMTIDDPLHFVHAWDVSITYKRVTNLDRMLPYDCTENDRNPVVNGRLVVAPP
jgi:hypothetical protein